MNQLYIENTINILTNENSNNDELNKVLNELLNYFNRDRVYISLFESYLNKKKLNLYMIITDIFDKKFLNEEKYKKTIFDLIDILINNYELSIETISNIYQNLSKIYFNESLVEENRITSYLKLLYHFYQIENVKNINPTNYFFFHKNCNFEYQFDENRKINVSDCGLCVTMYIRLMTDSHSSDNSIKLFSFSNNNNPLYNYSFILKTQSLMLYDEENKNYLQTNDNKKMIKFTFNSQIILTFLITNELVKFMIEGNNNEYVYKTNKNNEINYLNFFNNCSGECSCLIITKVNETTSIKKHFNDITKYTKLYIDPKNLSLLLQFYKTENIISYFIPYVYSDKNNIFEDIVKYKTMKMNGIECGIHKFFNNNINVSCIGGIKNILPLLEIAYTNINKFSNESLKLIFETVLKIMKNLFEGNEFNINDCEQSHFIEILSLFMETISPEFFTLFMMKQLYEFVHIFEGKHLQNIFINDIILNEKLYYSFNLETQEHLMNELIKNNYKIISIEKICLLLKYYDEKKNKEYCCDYHYKAFIKNTNYSDKIMEIPLNIISKKQFELIESILNDKENFSTNNYITLFRMLSLDISPCLVKRIIQLFIEFFSKKNERLLINKLSKELGNPKNKFWEIIIKLLRTCLYDVKCDILDLIMLIPKENFDDFSYKFPNILNDNLLFKEQFLDENNQFILTKEYVDKNYMNLYYSLFSLILGKQVIDMIVPGDKIQNHLLIDAIINAIICINSKDIYIKFAKDLGVLLENNLPNSSLLFNNYFFLKFILDTCYNNFNDSETKILFDNYNNLIVNFFSNASKDSKNVASNIINYILYWSKISENKNNIKSFIKCLFVEFLSYLDDELNTKSLYNYNVYHSLISFFSIYLNFSTIYNINQIEDISDYTCFLKSIIITDNKWEELNSLETIYNNLNKDFNLDFLKKTCKNENVKTLKQKNLNIINSIIFNQNYKNLRVNELTNLNYSAHPNYSFNKTILIFIYLAINLCESNNEKIRWINELKTLVLFYIIFSSNLYSDIEESFNKSVQNYTIYLLYFSYCFLYNIYNDTNDSKIKSTIEEFNKETISLILMIHQKYVQSKESSQKSFIGKLFNKGLRTELEKSAIYLLLNKYTNLNTVNLEKYEKDNYNALGNIFNNNKEPFNAMIIMNQNLKSGLNQFFEIQTIINKVNNWNKGIFFYEIKPKISTLNYEELNLNLIELICDYQGTLSKYSNCSFLINKEKKNYYKKLKKEIFSWRGMWSCKEDLFNNKYKYKILNHFTKSMGRPLILPILDINYYKPKFRRFNQNNLFRNKVECHSVNLDIDSIFKSKEKENENEKINYLKYISSKNLKETFEKYINFSLNIDIFKEEKLFINYFNSLRNLSPPESPLRKSENFYKCCFVKTDHHIKGFFFINQKEISFRVFHFNIQDNDLIYDKEHDSCYGSTFGDSDKDKDSLTFSIPYDNIKIIFRKRYCQRDTGIEILNKNLKGNYFSFINKNDREKCLNDIKNHLECYEIKMDTNKNIDEFKNIVGYLIGKKKFFSNKNLTQLIKKWTSFQISNFEFLMWLNLYSNRSYFDLLQYPIFPWIITNYKTNEINLESDIRDFSLPMGMMSLDDVGKERKESYIEHFNIMKEEFDEKKNNLENNNENDDLNLLMNNKFPYFYGTHMSNPIYVAHFLTRFFPFSNIAIEMQGEGFDTADRLFFSIEGGFHMASTQKNDVREIIPEFFICPEIFINLNDLNLGTLTEGILVQDVEIPIWGKDCYYFIYLQRKILESDVVSEKINNWINLIFGFNSRGENAIKKNNVFSPDSYEIDIEKFDGEMREVKLRTCDFGLMPKQLSTSEFPVRKKNDNYKNLFDVDNVINIYESITVSDSKEKKILDFKILKEENRIILIDKENDITVFRLNTDNLEYKHMNKSLKVDNSNNDNQNKRLKDKFHILRNMIFASGENETGTFYNKNLNFVGVDYNNNINVPILYIKNPNKENLYTIIQGGFYLSKLILTTVDVNNYSLNYTEKKDNIKEYESLYFSNLPYSITALCLLHDEKELKKLSEFDINILCGNSLGNIFICRINEKNNKKKGEIKTIFSNHFGKINSLFYSSNLSIFASCSVDGYINLYTMPSYKLFRSIKINLEEFSCDKVFLISSPLPSVIIFSKNNNCLLSYNINGHFLMKFEEKGIKCPKIVRDSNFNEYLVYIYSENSIGIVNLPYFDYTKNINIELNKIECIDVTHDFQYCFIGNEDASNIIYLKNSLK